MSQKSAGPVRLAGAKSAGNSSRLARSPSASLQPTGGAKHPRGAPGYDRGNSITSSHRLPRARRLYLGDLHLRALLGGTLGHDGEQGPLAGHALERLRAALLECDPRADDQVAHRARYQDLPRDRKSSRLNSSHSQISYAVFCLKKKKHQTRLMFLLTASSLSSFNLEFHSVSGQWDSAIRVTPLALTTSISASG